MIHYLRGRAASRAASAVKERGAPNRNLGPAGTFSLLCQAGRLFRGVTAPCRVIGPEWTSSADEALLAVLSFPYTAGMAFPEWESSVV